MNAVNPAQQIGELISKLLEERSGPRHWTCLHFPRDFDVTQIKQFLDACEEAELPVDALWWAVMEYDRELDATCPILFIAEEDDDDASLQMGLIHSMTPDNSSEPRVSCTDFYRVSSSFSAEKLDVSPLSEEQRDQYYKKLYNKWYGSSAS
ncbi:hypothetical protein FWH30_03210 [Microgenomates group bacterium]|nr:hypothetical protein [Microgenomates group bacterium]